MESLLNNLLAFNITLGLTLDTVTQKSPFLIVKTHNVNAKYNELWYNEGFDFKKVFFWYEVQQMMKEFA